MVKNCVRGCFSVDAFEKFDYWERKATYDLETARIMLQTGRYTYVVFMAQQAVEKIVKDKS